jgi:hypothetical protein
MSTIRQVQKEEITRANQTNITVQTNPSSSKKKEEQEN